ncbi:hypothetical protein ACFWIQ_20685 [Kitasatospora sp. NPDC127059]|uniref:hypothetical protein n=1 Tax=unclassified Kitasatospora TaxID=2633591 RepID=UPI00364768D0
MPHRARWRIAPAALLRWWQGVGDLAYLMGWASPPHDHRPGAAPVPDADGAAPHPAPPPALPPGHPERLATDRMSPLERRLWEELVLRFPR